LAEMLVRFDCARLRNASTAQLSNYGAPASSFLSSSRLVQQVANGATDAAQGSNSAGATAAAAIIVSRNGAPTAPKKLAAAYPEKGRAEAERVFASLLALYPKVEQKFGIPANDLAAAVALFLVSSVEAYRGVSIDPEQFKTLAAQLRMAMNANPDIAKAPEAEKQEMYEQMVVIGMFLQGVQEALKPGWIGKLFWGAHSTLELPLGAIRSSRTAKGDRIEWEEHVNENPASSPLDSITGSSQD